MDGSLPRVALLTDDLLLRSRLEGLIAAAGATVDAAGTPGAVADLLSGASPPQAVVLDLSAGNLRPLPTISQLRERYPEVPIVAFGPHTDREAMAEAARHGCASVLPRSRAVRELTNEVRRVLAKDVQPRL